MCLHIILWPDTIIHNDKNLITMYKNQLVEKMSFFIKFNSIEISALVTFWKMF